ncbi:MAG: hypothetical protein ACJ8AT_25255 [Hyalangium sp.]|uniref:hypothetical protein n=1 Tax=Hyalangium sp. TaxID=2028555 RepID=UPI00389ACED5
MSRFFRAVSTLALAGLLTRCATSSGAGGTAAAGDAVPLRFAWPEGLTVQVSSTDTTTQSEQAPEHSELSYQLRLEGKGEERKLITEEMKPTAPAATPEEGPPPPTPAMVLGPQGELRRIEGIDQVVQQMAQEAESQGLPQEQQAQITKLVRDALEQATRLRWEVLVGKWNGLVLKPGEAVERKGQTTVPLFGSNVATVEHVSLKEHVPCTEGAKEKRCVRLVLESSIDQAGLAQATDQLLGKVKAVMKANMGLEDQALPELKVTKLRLDSTLEFIAEPETLVPHRQRTVTSSQVELQEPDADPKNFDIQSERVETFTPAGH